MKENRRSSGVLLSISSLPSDYGIGDFGPEAYAFADMLSRTNQRYWQLLPVNPIEDAQGNSPYSALSGFAGNTLLISPEMLVKDRLLGRSKIDKYRKPSSHTVDFGEAKAIRDTLLMEAFEKFKGDPPEEMAREFRKFRNQQSDWLNDYALFVCLKHHHQGKPWFEWEQPFRQRDEASLKRFSREKKQELEKEIWLQYIFLRQWKDLKKYCNDKHIRLFGDLPFYVSYDSSDVWSNRNLFSLDKEGRILKVAGVPPDYFNEDGQLWGMPVFRWDVLKRQGYDWWIRRIRKNMELFDLLRLDHFRAFADYWEVDASEKTAKKGHWRTGPGKKLFEAFAKSLGDVPFVAEDLGDINEPVYELRDEFKLPGMVVLQFAFGNAMADSIYIPHNYIRNSICYTGTHDNNTTAGWFRQDADKMEKKNLAAYLGKKPTEKNVAQLLTQLAFSSVADTVIIPIQDLLGLDESARMNKPASAHGNWKWRLQKDQVSPEDEARLKQLTQLYNRENLISTER